MLVQAGGLSPACWGLELLVCQDAQMTTLDEPAGKSRAQLARKGNAAIRNGKIVSLPLLPTPWKALT